MLGTERRDAAAVLLAGLSASMRTTGTDLRTVSECTPAAPDDCLADLTASSIQLLVQVLGHRNGCGIGWTAFCAGAINGRHIVFIGPSDLQRAILVRCLFVDARVETFK
jgi:hypothetical protein